MQHYKKSIEHRDLDCYTPFSLNESPKYTPMLLKLNPPHEEDLPPPKKVLFCLEMIITIELKTSNNYCRFEGKALLFIIMLMLCTSVRKVILLNK